jgi:hypothetical protein
MIATHRGTV